MHVSYNEWILTELVVLNAFDVCCGGRIKSLIKSHLHIFEFKILITALFFKLCLNLSSTKCRISILLHSSLNSAWYFWFSTRFSCCLNMKSGENIFGYIQVQFYRFLRGCKPWENIWNCSWKYTKMFKMDSFLGNKKLSLN